MRKKGTLFLGMAALLLAGTGVSAAGTAPEASFGGQYRINSYTLMDKDGAGNIAASRVRIRQNVDLKFSEEFRTHIQFNIGHITEGIGNHGTNSSGTDQLSTTTAGVTTKTDQGVTVGLRHAVMKYKFSDAAILVAGLVPLSDKFGDTLFSGDWDFNPLTYALVGNSGGFDYRVGSFTVAENGESDETTAGGKTMDDTGGYLLDLGGDLGVAKVGVMGLIIQTPNAAVAADGYDSNSWYGVRADGEVSGLKWHLSGVGSSVNKNVGNSIDTDSVTAGVQPLFVDDASGIQLLAKVDGKAGSLGWGVLALNSSGDKGNKGFISPQTLYGGQGYWGKTGILNIQGPTDTGMDANMLRTDNGGLGLMTIQANVSSPLTDNLGGYLGAGFYQANQDNAAGSKDIGTDIYAEVKYSFPNSPLALQAGVDVASLGKAAPNSGGKTRTATAVFTRLQAEF